MTNSPYHDDGACPPLCLDRPYFSCGPCLPSLPKQTPPPPPPPKARAKGGFRARVTAFVFGVGVSSASFWFLLREDVWQSAQTVEAEIVELKKAVELAHVNTAVGCIFLCLSE